MGIPHEVGINMEQFANWDMPQELLKKANIDTDLIKGNLNVVRDPTIISEMKSLRPPKITNTTNFKKASRYPHPFMDKITINQTILLSLTTEDSDVSVLPVEMNWSFFARHRPGPLLLYGQTQEIKAEGSEFEFKVKGCETITNPHKIIQNEDDEDDFESDDEEDKPKASKLKPSILGQMICSAVPIIQEKVGNSLAEDLSKKLKLTHE